MSRISCINGQRSKKRGTHRTLNLLGMSDAVFAIAGSVSRSRHIRGTTKSKYIIIPNSIHRRNIAVSAESSCDRNELYSLYLWWIQFHIKSLVLCVWNIALFFRFFRRSHAERFENRKFNLMFSLRQINTGSEFLLHALVASPLRK